MECDWGEGVFLLHGPEGLPEEGACGLRPEGSEGERKWSWQKEQQEERPWDGGRGVPGVLEEQQGDVVAGESGREMRLAGWGCRGGAGRARGPQ